MNVFINDYFEAFNKVIEDAKSKNLIDNQKTNIKLSNILKNSSNTYLQDITISNEINLKNDKGTVRLLENHSIYLHHTGTLYHRNFEFNVDICVTIDWQIINKNIKNSPTLMEKNPFLKLYKSQYALYYKNFADINTYFENTRLGDFMEILNPFYVRIENAIPIIQQKNIKRYQITNKKTLLNYSQYQLFLCNQEFYVEFYKIFNCTPFFNIQISQYDNLVECPAIYIPLINDIFSKLSNQVFECEIVDNLKTIHVSSTALKRNVHQTLILDFNHLHVYKQDKVKEYDLITLIVNISNFWNVLIGFSFISLLELIYLFYIHIFTSKLNSITVLHSIN